MKDKKCVISGKFVINKVWSDGKWRFPNVFLNQEIVWIIHILEGHISIFDYIHLKPIYSIKDYEIIFWKETELRFRDIKTNTLYDLKFNINDYNIQCINIIPTKTSFWKQEKIKLNLVEDDIRNNVLLNIKRYFPDIDISQTFIEFPIDLGRIDILFTDYALKYHIIEIKKKDTNFNTIDQVLRYWEYYRDIWVEVELYVIWVENTYENREYAEARWVKIIEFIK